MELLYDPVIPLLGKYLKKPKAIIQKNVCTPIFIAALFTIAHGIFIQWNTTQP